MIAIMNLKSIWERGKGIVIPAVWSFIAIASSAGAMNSMENFYIVIGLLNLVIHGVCIYKYIMK